MNSFLKLTYIGCLLYIHVIQGDATNDDRVARAAQHHVVELLLVADYSFYSRWYNATSPTDTTQTREATAETKVKEYVSTLLHSTNNAYKTLEPHNIFITIKAVQLLIMTRPEDSPWTESIKTLNTTESVYELDPDRVLDLFLQESTSVHTTIPHDYAMLLTAYKLHKSDGKYLNGYAVKSSECKDRGVSVVRDTQFETALTIAHEMGHSLACGHDGSDNSCHEGEGYIMEEGLIRNSSHKWEFSSCSVTDITNYLNRLYNIHDDCMLTTENHHPSADLVTLATKWFGQLFSPDDLCTMQNGIGSFADRDHPYNNYTSICGDLRCLEPGSTSRYTKNLGPDGMPCGNGKWCMYSQCVADKNAPSVPDDCPIGDQPGVIKNGRTCQDLVKADPNECNTKLVKRKCCHTCAHVQTTSIPFDQQCANYHGAGSILCRTASSYTGKVLQDVMCAELHCVNPNNTNSCPSHKADDKTTCGNKKWCVDQKCVHSNQAPTVSDACPWGDRQGIVSDNLHLACVQFKEPANQRYCYNTYLALSCCDSCAQIHRNVTGCEYGDKKLGCTVQSCPFYSTDERAQCCETCHTAPVGNSTLLSFDDQCANKIGTGSTMCRTASPYTGKIVADIVCSDFYCSDPHGGTQCSSTTAYDKTPCGNQKWCMNGACVHDTHAQHVSDTCIWGDEKGIASYGLTCAQIGLPENQHYCYKTYVSEVCCGTCESVQRNITDCKYGDKTKGCSVQSCPFYNVDQMQSCCETCLGATAVSTVPITFDQQCVNKHGAGSTMCRATSFYDGKNLSSVICNHYNCINPKDSHFCITSTAFDKTSCGYKKWCMNAVCVNDEHAPALSDECFWGNVPGIATSGLTCEQIKIANNQFHCYSDYTRTVCCDACDSIKRNITGGCEYGDKLHGCSRPSCHSYDADTRTKCCETCGASTPAIVG